MARYGVLKTETEESIEVLKWLDRSLIRLVVYVNNIIIRLRDSLSTRRMI